MNVPFLFNTPLIPGYLIKRYKRFLADVRLEDGSLVTAHCPNTGAMRDLVEPGLAVFLSYHTSRLRKYPYTWENVQLGPVRVGVNTHTPNRFVAHCLTHQLFPELQGYTHILREVTYDATSRVDFFLQGTGLPDCYMEVKNVHFKEVTQALFPDSPTVRGTKHMAALARQVAQGRRAIVLYLIQREDVETFGFGDMFDPVYADTATRAYEAGVEVWPYTCVQDSFSMCLKQRLPFVYRGKHLYLKPRRTRER